MRFLCAVLCTASLVCAWALPAFAQNEVTRGNPSHGIDLPAAPIAGDQDATSVVTNPGGTPTLGGSHLALVFTGLDHDHSGDGGSGFGVYFAKPFQAPFLPQMSVGLGVEKLIAPQQVFPATGAPVRFTLAYGVNMGGFSVGLNWSHFFDDAAMGVGGLDTFDLGVSTRFGAHWAAGAVVRSFNNPSVNGLAVERRYGAELLFRPLASDRLELAAGFDVGEDSGHPRPNLRLGARLIEGVWLRGEVSLEPHLVLNDANDPSQGDDLQNDWRASVGLEFSFGNTGFSVFGTGGRSVGGGTRVLGGTTIVRLSSERYPSMLPRSKYVTKLAMKGAIGERELTAYTLRLRQYEKDPKVQGVVLAFDRLAAGWAAIQELRKGILRLRKAGKKVYAFMIAGGIGEYYLASAADHIFIDPAGGLRVQGLASRVLFFGEMFAKIGVKAQFEKIDEYKTAPEAFTRSSPTEENKAMRGWLLDGIYDRVAADIAKSRGVSPQQAKQMIEGGPYTAPEAKKAGLVDTMIVADKLDKAIFKKMGRRYPVLSPEPQSRQDRWLRPQIAIIYIDGDIVDGQSRRVPITGQKLVGGDTIVGAITWARSAPNVKAIVLRINTPGGSALASELIFREVLKTRKSKPIIVSMGNIATSGGYYAAAGGDLIYAQPSTITGSIGIFSGKSDMSELLGSLGFSWYTERRGPRADMDSMYRPYTPAERAMLKEKLRYFYNRFLSAVSKGRDLKKEDVHKVAEGRVWTGEQAKARFLVDRYGGLMDAILEAKRRAGYHEDTLMGVALLPQEPQSLLSRLMQLGSSRSADGVFRSGTFGEELVPEERSLQTTAEEWPVLGPVLGMLPASLLAQPSVAQARLPFFLEIR